MKICELKLNPKFWFLIQNKMKKYEIRKLNKNYIEMGDVIKFIDTTDKDNILGYAIVCSKTLIENPELLQTFVGLDKESKEFIKKMYKNENKLISLNIEPIEVFKCNQDK